VALVKGMADDVRALLDVKAPVVDADAADTAIFYSISNCQRGLTGISFGDFLIKRVVDRLAAELPHLKTYATLSPVPRFRGWLERQLAKGGDPLTPAERKELPEEVRDVELGVLLVRPHWYDDLALVAALRPPLMRLCARYLLLEKRPSGTALDSVAHFHLTNGARIEQIDWAADLSPNGLKQSLGLMINYLYRLSEIEHNHEAYVSDHHVAASTAVQRLAKM